MDRECVSLLPRVCEVLRGSGSSLPDDTSLEKLLDWFTGLTEAGQYHPSMHSFIFLCLSEVRPCWQEAKRHVPDIPLPSYDFQLFLVDPEAIPSQIPLASSG